MENYRIKQEPTTRDQETNATHTQEKMHPGNPQQLTSSQRKSKSKLYYKIYKLYKTSENRNKQKDKNNYDNEE